MPSLATQTVEQLGGAGSALSRQRQHHMTLDGLLEQLQRTTGEEHDEVRAAGAVERITVMQQGEKGVTRSTRTPVEG